MSKRERWFGWGFFTITNVYNQFRRFTTRRPDDYPVPNFASEIFKFFSNEVFSIKARWLGSKEGEDDNARGKRAD